MSENYRDSEQWQALNRIWKAVPAAARDSVKNDFKVITDMIKSAAGPVPVAAAAPAVAPVAAPAPAMAAGGMNFLAGLSADAKKLALGMLTKEGFNLYDCLAELAVSTKAEDEGELFDAYVSQRDIDDGQEDALMEIIAACMKRMREGA